MEGQQIDQRLKESDGGRWCEFAGSTKLEFERRLESGEKRLGDVKRGGAMVTIDCMDLSMEESEGWDDTERVKRLFD